MFRPYDLTGPDLSEDSRLLDYEDVKLQTGWRHMVESVRPYPESRHNKQEVMTNPREVKRE